MARIRLGISAALFGKQGKPCFDEAILKQVSEHPDIEMIIMEDEKTHISAEDAQKFDAVYLMLERVRGRDIDTPDRKLKLISRHGVGFDAIEIAEMSRLGIMVTNTPDAVRRPVATMAITMLLSLSHRLIEKHNLTRAGRWGDSPDFMGSGLTGKVLGVLGAGSIGSEILRLAAPFEMKQIACDPHVSEAALNALNTQKVDIDTLFSSADYLIIATALTEDTYHLVNKARLDRMKTGASLINIARGPVVREADLIAALQSGRLAAAGLDVFETEPVEMDNPLLKMDNVITTAHSLCWTDECFDNIARDGLGSVLRFVNGEKPLYIVNPDVSA